MNKTQLDAQADSLQQSIQVLNNEKSDIYVELVQIRSNVEKMESEKSLLMSELGRLIQRLDELESEVTQDVLDQASVMQLTFQVGLPFEMYN